MDKVISINGLTKKYDKKVAVDYISLDIKQGEIFGLLGPNGAGKSTTLNMLCSLIKPTSGTMEIFGLNPDKNRREINGKIGYVPQELAIHENLKAWENVELFGALYGLKKQELKDRTSEALSYVELEEHRNNFAKTFSGGMKRRLNIACALAHHPKLLIFDEPTVGIDPQSRNFILEMIKKMNREGATILYTSHYMEEIEAICTRIGIMDNGKIIAMGTKQELVDLVRTDENENMTLEQVFLTLTGKSLRDYGEGEN